MEEHDRQRKKIELNLKIILNQVQEFMDMWNWGRHLTKEASTETEQEEDKHECMDPL